MVHFREAVYFEGKRSLDTRRDKVQLSLCDLGVFVKTHDKTLLVPFGNCLWMQVGE